MIQIQRPWPWQSVNTLARTELIKGCNPSRYSLALINEFSMGLFNVFSSSNGIRNTRWWESKACSIRSGFRRDPRPTLQTWVKSRSDTYIIGSTKSYICAVERCSDNISLWISRFRHVWFPMESLSESKHKCNMYCVIINKSPHTWLIVVGTFWYNSRSEFLIQKDYSYMMITHVCLSYIRITPAMTNHVII